MIELTYKPDNFVVALCSSKRVFLSVNLPSINNSYKMCEIKLKYKYYCHSNVAFTMK